MKKTLILIGVLFVFLALAVSNADASYLSSYWGYPTAVGVYAYNYPSYGYGGYNGFYGGGYGIYGGGYGGCAGYYGHYSNCGSQSQNLVNNYIKNSKISETSQNNLKNTYDFIGNSPVKYDFSSNSYDYNPWESYGFQGYGNYQQPSYGYYN